MNCSLLKKYFFKPKKLIIVSEDSSRTIYLPSFLQLVIFSFFAGFAYFVGFTVHSYKNVASKTIKLENKIKVCHAQNKNLTSEINTASSYIEYFNKYLSLVDGGNAVKVGISPDVNQEKQGSIEHLKNQFQELRKNSAKRMSYLSGVLFSSGFSNVSDFSKIGFVKTQKKRFTLFKDKKGKKRSKLGGPFEEVSDANFKFEDLSTDDLIKLEKIFQAIPRGMPMKAGYVSSHFGNRNDPFNHSGAFHGGIDIASLGDKKIMSIEKGVVKRLELNHPGYGKFVEIDHGNNVTTLYAHMNKVFVKKGAYVLKNQVLGLEGSSGRATGAHLHFEIRYKNQRVNPFYFISPKNES